MPSRRRGMEARRVPRLLLEAHSTHLVEDKGHDASGEDSVAHVDVVVGPETL